MFQPLQGLGGGGDDTVVHQSLGDVWGDEGGGLSR